MLIIENHKVINDKSELWYEYKFMQFYLKFKFFAFSFIRAIT